MCHSFVFDLYLANVNWTETVEVYTKSMSNDYEDEFARSSSISDAIFSKQIHAVFQSLPILVQSSKSQYFSFSLVSLLAIVT